MQIDNVKDIEIVMSLYNLIECSNNYSNTSGSLWKYYKNIPAINNNGDIFLILMELMVLIHLILKEK